MDFTIQNSTVDLLGKALKAEYEQKHIIAFLYYKRALLHTNSFEQKTMLRTALLRMGEKISSTTVMVNNQVELTIKQKHNNRRIKWTYDSRLETKAVCDAVLPVLDNATNVLLIDFTQGFVSTRISEAGSELISLVPYSDIQRYMLYEYSSQKRDQFRELFYSKQQTFVLENKIPENLSYDLSIVIVLDDKKWDFASIEQKKHILSELIINSKKGFVFVFADNNKNFKILQELENNFKNITIQKQKISEKNWLILSNDVLNNLLVPPIADVSNIVSGKTRFKVKLDKCRDLTAKPYDRNHHFVKTLLEYPNHSEYKGSALEEYYDNFRPENRQQVYGFNKKTGAMSQGWPLDPWRTIPKVPVRTKRYETRKGGNHLFGPNSLEFGNGEFKRLIDVHNKLSKNGYQPELYNDGFILGYFLIKDNDYRFVVTEGQHRIPSLAKFGYEYIDIKIYKRYLSPKIFVRYEDVADFPHVKQGIYTEEEALACFDHYFK